MGGAATAAALCFALAPNCFNLPFCFRLIEQRKQSARGGGGTSISIFIFAAGEVASSSMDSTDSEVEAMAEAPEMSVGPPTMAEAPSVGPPVASPVVLPVFPAHPFVPARKASATLALSVVDVVVDGISEHEWGSHS